jgi:SsrA-binding protein
MEARAERIIANNKKAYHDYFIEETYQAGIELAGTEVKSLRAGRCNLKDSYVEIDRRQAYINGMHISPYEQGNIFNKDPLRRRRLLLHKFQINRLLGASARGGYTIVPTRVYFSGSFVKIDVALAKGKKLYDKRASLSEKAQRREMEREFKEREHRS